MQFIQQALAAGSNPTIAPSGATVLKNGRSFRNLVTAAGKLTTSGRLFEQESGTELRPRSRKTPGLADWESPGTRALNSRVLVETRWRYR